ncbi:hypothetical protein DFH05DRAFT_1062896, partial [Lentinula detonsa]
MDNILISNHHLEMVLSALEKRLEARKRQRLEQQQQEQQTPTPHRQRIQNFLPPSSDGLFDNDELLTDPSQHTSNDISQDQGWDDTGTSHIISMGVSSAFVKKLKETVELADEAKETLDKYVQASTLAERLTMQYALSLSIQGKINSIVEQREANWKVSSSLKKIITMYAKGYVLSSMARFYISCAPDRIIMNILRSSNVKELPTEEDITGNSILQSSIGRALTNARNQAKDHILSTTSKAQKQVPEDERDLGTVAQALIGDFVDIPCSLALLYRIAIMRGVIDTEPENVVKTAKFWPAVDKEMASRLG